MKDKDPPIDDIYRTKNATGDAYLIQIIYDMYYEREVDFKKGKGKFQNKNKIINHLGKSQSSTPIDKTLEYAVQLGLLEDIKNTRSLNKYFHPRSRGKRDLKPPCFFLTKGGEELGKLIDIAKTFDKATDMILSICPSDAWLL